MMDPYQVTTDKSKFNFELIYQFISNSYWAKNIPRQVMKKAIDNSLCFGVFDGLCQVGFARVVTDGATFGYLADVFVLPSHRGLGLSKLMMEKIIIHPELQGLRRMMLATADAHGLYQQFDFKPLSKPANMMECWDPDIYL